MTQCLQNSHDSGNLATAIVYEPVTEKVFLGFFWKKMKMLLENIKLFLFLQPLQGNTERCLSGRKERFAKPSYGLNCIEGSNPSLSAEIKSLQVLRFEGFLL
jgi:hypothetical protein